MLTLVFVISIFNITSLAAETTPSTVLAIPITASTSTADSDETAHGIWQRNWQRNRIGISIYEPDGDYRPFFEVQYDNPAGQHGYITEHFNPNDHIRLLMIDGGFVPEASLIIRNNRTLAPVDVVSLLGLGIEQTDSCEISIAIFDGAVLLMNVGETEATMYMGTIFEKQMTTDTAPEIIEGRLYLPLRFVAEAFGFEVQYFGTFNFLPNSFRDYILIPRDMVSVAVIESLVQDSESLKTPEDGLDAIIPLSLAKYEVLLEYYESMGAEFGDADAHNRDYDPTDIFFTEVRLGRFYVFQLRGFDFMIFFNRVTGQVYSEKAGLPFIRVEEGFINITWLYQ